MNKTKWQKLVDFWNSWTGTIIFVLFFIFFIAQAFSIPSGSMRVTLLEGDKLFVKKFSYGIPIPHIPFLEIPVLPDFRGDGHLLSYAKPERGDIVVFRYPLNPNLHFVKRCFAKGNDEVIFHNETMYLRPYEGDEYMKEHFANKLVTLQGKLYIKEPYDFKGIHYDQDKNIQAKYQASLSRLIMQPVWVEELNQNYPAFYFKVPADEYFMVGDNRNNSDDSRFWGSVPYKYIEGSPWFIYLSWDDKYNIRWDRMFKSVDELQNNEKYIHLPSKIK